MALLAEHSFEQIGLAEVAGRAGLKLSQLARRIRLDARRSSPPISRTSTARCSPAARDMAEEPPRERLFDVLMRRLEALAPYKEAVRSLMRSARRNPGLALALNAMAVRSQTLDAGSRRHRRARAARRVARARRGADVRARAGGLVRRRRAGPRPHHGRARPRARQRRALGRFPRRSVFAAEMHRARPAPPPPSRRGRAKRRSDVIVRAGSQRRI